MVSFWRHLSPLFPLFWGNQKGVFWIFLKMGNLYGFEHENHSEQVHNLWPYELTWKEQLFLTFEKIWFFPFVTQHKFSKKWKFSKVGKNGFWWYIRTCHSQFSGFWSFICQNWLKIVVFTTFRFDFNYNYSNKNSTTKIPEKLICSQKVPVGFSLFFACGSEF